ncbi:O-antigen ligase family protein [Candidatus Clostridium stratigraminis]
MMIYYSTLLLSIVNFSMVIPITSQYSIYYFYVTLFIYAAAYALYYFRNIKTFDIKAILKNKYIIFLIVFLCYMVITTFIAADKKLAIKYIYNYIIMALLAMMIFVENNTISKLKNTLKYLLYIYGGILFTGLLQIAGITCELRNHFEEWDPESFAQLPYVNKIPVTFFYNPNNYAVFLVLSMTVLMVAYLYTKNKKEKTVLSIFYLISLINLIFTRSRTAWASLFLIIVFCIAIYLIKERRNIINVKRLTGIFIASLMVFFVLSTVPAMEPFYGKLATTSIFHFFGSSKNKQPVLIIGNKGSDAERYTLAYDVIHGIFKDKNYFGFGPGNVEKYVEKMNNTYGVLNVHSLWLEMLGDFGIIFFIYFLIIFLYVIKENVFVSYSEEERGGQFFTTSAALFFGLVFLSFAPSSIMWYTPFWITIGIAYRTASMRTEE